MNRYLRVVRFLGIPFVDLIQQVGCRESWWGGESEFGVRERPRTMGIGRFLICLDRNLFQTPQTPT